MKIILFGPPGSGKGTQARLLEKAYKLKIIATGDLVRAQMAAQTPQAHALREYVKQGHLLPGETVNQLIQQAIHDTPDFILDGYPRTREQAVFLDKLLTEMDSVIDAVIFLDVDPEKLLERIESRYLCKKCGASYNTAHPTQQEGVCDFCAGGEFLKRPDDNATALAQRIEEYLHHLQPLLEFYKERVCRIEGIQDIEMVEHAIHACLPAQ